MHAPHLIDLEVTQVLRRALRRGFLSEAAATGYLAEFANLRLTRYPHRPLGARIWELGANVSAYDGAYLALAEALDLPLVTTDGRLGRAPGHRAAVEVFGGSSSS